MVFPHSTQGIYFLYCAPYRICHYCFCTIELDVGWMENDEARPGVTVCVLDPIFSILWLLYSFHLRKVLECCCVFFAFEIIKVFFLVFTNWMSTQDQATFIVVVHGKKIECRLTINSFLHFNEIERWTMRLYLP